MADSARQDIKLLAFPEAFLPGYPDWVWIVPAGEGIQNAHPLVEALEPGEKEF